VSTIAVFSQLCCKLYMFCSSKNKNPSTFCAILAYFIHHLFPSPVFLKSRLFVTAVVEHFGNFKGTWLAKQNKKTTRSLTRLVSFHASLGCWLFLNRAGRVRYYIQNQQSFLALNSYLHPTRCAWHVGSFLEDILFQAYAVEVFFSTLPAKKNRDGKVFWRSHSAGKLSALSKLHSFQKQQLLQGGPYATGMVSRLSQILLTLILDPLVETTADMCSFGLRKGRSVLLAVGFLKLILHRNLQKKVRLPSLFA